MLASILTLNINAKESILLQSSSIYLQKAVIGKCLWYDEKLTQ